jgi:hypothetical protein
MKTEYTCKICSYKSKYFIDMIRHLNRQKLCHKNLNGYKYTDEEILKLSLLPYEQHKQIYDKNKFKSIIGKTKITKNKYFEIFNNIEKNKLKICPICDKCFDKKIELKKHIIIECVVIDCNNDNENIETIIHQNITNNITNNNNNNNITNNVNITNNIQCPVSFDDEWDISHMTNEEKSLLLISMYKYTKTLEFILKNNKNLNVVVDKKTQSGLVYKNNSIEIMSLSDICDKSFDKLNIHLNSFYDDVIKNNEFEIDPDLLKHEKKVLRIKYGNYQYNEKDKTDERNNIIKNYINIKDKALEKLNEINKINNNIT